MKEDNSQRSLARAVREKGQYLIAFVVVASLLLVAQVPIFVVFFFGIFAYFMAKMFSAGSKGQTREIFEFYLSAHEILRDDLRRWYGYEINEAITRGERILKSMPHAPPLVHFALGSLYEKVGDHSAAVKHLSYISEDPESFESSVVYPTPELRSYVSVLRKIEREPSDAPLTSAAVRSLERSRKIKGETLLSECRAKLAQLELAKPKPAELAEGNGASEPASDRSDTPLAFITNASFSPEADDGQKDEPDQPPSVTRRTRRRSDSDQQKYASRKPISEVLHDIYDKNVG